MAGKCCSGEMKTLEGHINKGLTKHAANNEMAGAGGGTKNKGKGKGKGKKRGK
jgi:hypothetical protein